MRARAFDHIQPGYRTVYGAILSKWEAEAYNSLQDRLKAYHDAGKPLPDNLLNASHKIMSAPK